MTRSYQEVVETLARRIKIPESIHKGCEQNKKMHLFCETTEITQPRLTNMMTSQFMSLVHIMLLNSKTICFLFYSFFINKSSGMGEKGKLGASGIRTSLLPF